MYELGCGIAKITPEIGLPLSGFIFRENNLSTSVDAPLFVRALVAVQSEGQLCCLINYDLLGIGASLEQQFPGELESQYIIDAIQVLITQTDLL